MKKKEVKKHLNSGITLIALVVTIVVLIILAGVSINLVLGDNGIITKAKEAKIRTQEETEEEKIKLALLSNRIENVENELGTKLYDKTIENGSKWNIIVIKETNKTYGTGWSFIEKGSIVENNVLQNNWLINDKTGETLKLEDNSYVQLSYNTSLGTTEGLIFNIDSSIIENTDKDTIQSQLGDNVELVNFDWNEASGLTKTSFNFDGVNDYIKIKYDNEEEKQTLAKNGFTFEFYGILDGGTSYNANGEVIDYSYKGIFCYWNGNEKKQAMLRFGLENINHLLWNAGFGNYLSDFSNNDSYWNIKYKNCINKGEEIYITITLDCSNIIEKENEEYYKQILYVNGEKLYEGNYNKKTWDQFITDDLNNLSYFCLGRSSVYAEGWWHYSKMNSYSLRLYNRALTEEEVSQNYDKSVAYHEALTK